MFGRVRRESYPPIFVIHFVEYENLLPRILSVIIPMAHQTSDEKKTAQDELRAQYDEIATLAGGLAHEIRNPLSTMSLNIELLAEEVSQGDRPQDRRSMQRIGTLQKECKNLDRILSDFLQFVKINELKPDVANLNKLVSEFIESFQPVAKDAGIDISPHLNADLPLVRLDSTFMRQVLMNLALNAQQAMPEGGILELQTSFDNDQVHLEMIDTGIGMDEKTIARMFQAFYSSKSTGSGLGLPTVRKIVQAHGGRISCESELGQGTRFTISLPAVK